MEALHSLLQNNENELLMKIRKLEDRLDSHEQTIQKLALENKYLHHIIYSLIKTQKITFDDVSNDPIETSLLNEMIESDNHSLSMFGINTFNHINSERKVDKPLESIPSETLVSCYSTTTNEIEKTNIIQTISKSEGLEYSTCLCDILIQQIGENDEIREDLAIDAFCRMKSHYKNVELISRLCQCLFDVPDEEVTKKLKLSYLIGRYTEVDETFIKKEMVTSGLIEYICDDHKSLQECGSLGILLIAMKNIFSDIACVDEIPFESLQSFIQSPLWYEEIEDQHWKNVNEFEPFGLIVSITNSKNQRSVINRSGLLEDIFEHVDVDNKECLMMLMNLNKVCPNDIVDYVEIIRDAMKDHQDDEAYLQTATQLLCDIAISQSGLKRKQ